jgi:hypothetical protein
VPYETGLMVTLGICMLVNVYRVDLQKDFYISSSQVAETSAVVKSNGKESMFRAKI